MTVRDIGLSRSGEELSAGVSVIIPTYRGRHHIQRCLDSLAAQTLPPDQFELVIVVNGEPDGTEAVIDSFRRQHPELRVRSVTVDVSGASRARNLGISAARRSFSTFVDDDDYVSPTFLASLLAHADERVVPIAYIADVTESQEPDVKNGQNEQISRWSGQQVSPAQVPRAMGHNAAKLIPTHVAAEVRYDVMLNSGEDVVFFMALLAHHAFVFHVVDDDAVYYRTIRPNSVSRREMTFEFCVEDRLSVISRLADLCAGLTDDRAHVGRALRRAQAGMIHRYLDNHPDQRANAAASIRRGGIVDFPFDVINRGLARTLVVSYCFVPYVDTSAVVAAKRIRTAGEVVDVVHNVMDSVRDRDPETTQIAAEFIEKALAIDSPSSFGNWKAIREFCVNGLAAIKSRHASGAHYDHLYSRVVWPASHFLAALFKARNPDVVWTAEFSDPVSRNIHGAERTSPLPDDELIRELIAAADKLGAAMPVQENVYAAAENIAFALADELVFTNENQRDYMLSYCPASLAAVARPKSTIAPHPTLSEEFYTASPADLRLDEHVLNIAYFGTFYATRNLDEVTGALRRLATDVRDRVRLHVFTAAPQDLHEQLRADRLDDIVVPRPYAPYLQFLNLTTRFDCLLINDAITRDTHSTNPYLPSKWSDYRGSGTPVWGVVEPGSPLSDQPLSYSTGAGDVDAARATIQHMVESKFPSSP